MRHAVRERQIETGGREERKGRLRKGGLWKWRAKEEDVGSWSNYREGDGERKRGESVTEEERVEIREKKHIIAMQQGCSEFVSVFLPDS